MQDLSPIGWALRPLKNYARFSGRASRAEFWWFFLFMMILYIGMWVVLFATLGLAASSGSKPSIGLLGAFGIGWILLALFWLAMIIPTIAVQVRRLHDTDRSGWWIGGFYLAYLVYVIFMIRIVASLQIPATGAPPDLSPMSGMGALSYVGFAFFVYSIVLLVFFCIGGTEGPNRYGDDPYGRKIEEVFA
jgi:uncharacterized membrane protein YhaH (DUF805 family)